MQNQGNPDQHREDTQGQGGQSQGGQQFEHEIQSPSAEIDLKKIQEEVSNTVEEAVIYWQKNDNIHKKLEEIKKTLVEVAGLERSFDVIFREMTFGSRRTGLFYLNGFAKDEVMTLILERLTFLVPDQLNTNAVKAFFECYIPHIQVEKVNKMSQVINKVLAGSSAFFMEHESTAIVMDVKNFPGRGPEEPSLERVVRGARDGFTETLLTNVTLVRRRLRDPGLKYELIQVGRRTRTDVAIAYIDDITNSRDVEAVRKKIKALDIDGLPLADKQLEEAIINKGWNPYPLVRYSERPDSVAAHLLDGNIVIFVDTSPSVMILPTTFFDLCQHAEENRETAFVGTYLRLVRFIGIFASLFVLPMWLLLATHPEFKPQALYFIGAQKASKLPLLVQFIIAELGVDLMRMAAIHTPTPLATAIGLMAAILLGDVAVKAGLFVNEVILYMAVAAIGLFATPSYELSLANRIVRLFLLILVAIFGGPGLIVGSTLIIVMLVLHRSYNSPYLWPFIPFNAKAMLNIIIRRPVLKMKERPSFNQTVDSSKMRKDES
ncbi:spore germination protein [Paenibacillus selenitireducens]|uniref:Spore germination protein n=1 Tax=Paenibacillus selenitireducens TaxID=1324314 RepID=A0A1T2XNT8_9BACL|nr:spore germination protein [Paenibacillus selenitireducens]OPA81559.1 spore germination protein [Paenibacillus selenitireducens]